MSKGARYEIAVVGAGPAGCALAARCAAAGARVAIFDHSHPRAKPCSGFLTREVFDIFSPLEEFHGHRPFDGPRLYDTPKGRRFTISSEKALTRFNLSSRILFDAFLLGRAIKSGATHIKEKVTGVKRLNKGWEIGAGRAAHKADILVGADGAKSLVRETLIGPIPKRDMVVGVGARYPGVVCDELYTRFFHGGEIGFVLPGYDFSQIVVAARLNKARDMLAKLHGFRASLGNKYGRSAKLWAGLQPSPVTKGFFNTKCCGDDFCLVGDAAGHCDSLNGEGIPFALRGGALAADAVMEGKVQSFEDRWRSEYGARLEKASAKARRAPGPHLIDCAGRACAKSPALVEVITSEAARNRDFPKVLGVALARFPKIVAELFAK